MADTAWSSAQRLLGDLGSLRADTTSPRADRSTDVSTYTQLVGALFAFDRVLTTDLSDARLTRQALSTYDLFAAREEIRYQQAVVLAGIDMRTMSVADVTSLHGSEARLDSRISDFRAVAGTAVDRDFEKSVAGSTLGHQSALLSRAIDQSGGMSGQVVPGAVIDIPVATWNAANDPITQGLNQVIGHLATSLDSTARTLRSDASASATTAVVVLLIALAATAALVVLIARQLLYSIGLLRRTARDVASRQLPDAVERIRAGETVDPTVEPVGVHTTDEVGQLARAFDAVHGEALRLAVEQANLRANYSELFVNLSRRSQSLVQRQLRLIEQLERDEEDPDQLSALFKLDHLATRMRRNNENLMVLSGGELARSTGQQVSLADLLRAGVSEIEHYQRIVVQPPPEAHIVGYAAGDLVRLLAELLDNATAFSAPDTPVTVASHRTRRKAIVIDIVDHGIGMSDEELVRANEQLSHPAGVEGRISRRMGLFVISRLADQHDVRVRLHGGQDIPGLRVTITVPAELVVSEPEPLPPNTQRDRDNPTDNGFGGPLPKRTAGATSRPNGPWHTALSGTLEETAAIATQAAADPAVTDPEAAAITVTIPQLPSAVSSGVGLFAPLSDEDEAPAEPVADGGEAVNAGQSPIFDTMLSAWFDEAPTGNGSAGTGRSRSRLAVRRRRGLAGGRRRRRGAAAEFTATGLPKRQPQALLLPGSVRTTNRVPTPNSPSGCRRNACGTGCPASSRACSVAARRPRPNRQRPNRPRSRWETVAEPVGLQPRRATAGRGRPRRRRRKAGRPRPTRAGGPPTRCADADPGEYTAAGLPRRRPKEHLLPGSVAPPSGRQPAHRRDAGVLRDRLSSFQRGVREGAVVPSPSTDSPSSTDSIGRTGRTNDVESVAARPVRVVGHRLHRTGPRCGARDRGVGGRSAVVRVGTVAGRPGGPAGRGRSPAFPA